MTDVPRDAEDFNRASAGRFPGSVGVDVLSIEYGAADLAVEVRDDHLAPNGFLHAGVVVTLADTACGYGCVRSLPEGAVGFTTIELKSNFLGTALSGRLVCSARAVHVGRTTQVWDATVTGPDERTIALFRCTQLILWPRA